ncbi:MAG: phosphatidate cytidylyltransferase [Pelovirga sp.]
MITLPWRLTIKQRLITAAIALPLLILLLAFASPAVFTLFVTLIVFAALFEFNRMGMGQEQSELQWTAALAGTIIVPLFFWDQLAWLFLYLSVVFLLLAFLFLLRPGCLTRAHHHLGWLVLGMIYVALLMGHLVLLRMVDDGRQWIFLTLVVIMCCDTCAYVIGSRFGKRKLYPLISPNKSIEGAIGGIGGAVLGALLAKMLFFGTIGLWPAVFIGIALGIVGQVGDLFESMLKRACAVKDSGNMVPGHGGILDRLDSLLFAFPLVFYIARWGFGG